jgi:hypothetical protein
MKHLIFLLLVGLLAFSGQAFSQNGSQGQHPAFSGQKKMAVIILDWSDKTAPSRQSIVDRLWNDPKSMRNYFKDLSRGAFEFVLPAGSTGGVAQANTPDIFGPYELSVAAGYTQDVTYANADDLFGGGWLQGVTPVARTIAEANGYNASNYDYIMYVTPKSDSTGGYEAMPVSMRITATSLR